MGKCSAKKAQAHRGLEQDRRQSLSAQETFGCELQPYGNSGFLEDSFSEAVSPVTVFDDGDRLAKQPLNRTAAQVADDVFYGNHPEMVQSGRRIPLSKNRRSDAPMRKEWMDVYANAGTEIHDPALPTLEAAPRPQPVSPKPRPKSDSSPGHDVRRGFTQIVDNASTTLSAVETAQHAKDPLMKMVAHTPHPAMSAVGKLLGPLSLVAGVMKIYESLNTADPVERANKVLKGGALATGGLASTLSGWAGISQLNPVGPVLGAFGAGFMGGEAIHERGTTHDDAKFEWCHGGTSDLCDESGNAYYRCTPLEKYNQDHPNGYGFMRMEKVRQGFGASLWNPPQALLPASHCEGDWKSDAHKQREVDELQRAGDEWREVERACVPADVLETQWAFSEENADRHQANANERAAYLNPSCPEYMEQVSKDQKEALGFDLEKTMVEAARIPAPIVADPDVGPAQTVMDQIEEFFKQPRERLGTNR